ncbi:AraC family transcriptional regulator [Vibrio sp. SCSIO 43137]|uniref:AraC family transcriptional regulator n=1 Tax=Vibrio sp. SCSIO 43137 TaxID=3021011 RepID=UPI002307A5E0|nr:GyrI-like domain-containing protein [Vibrio sp. SCSIO 43137]WCE32340.1 GyrI-like domain-containing protein [Vibrio sp. SCSIO 43137]
MAEPQQLARINDVLFSIHKDISRDLNAADLARQAAYSEQHFHRLFKHVVGEPVHQYICRIRMEYAANQLMFDPNATVIDIANKSGFSSVSSFSRAFKRHFTMSPGQWRRHEADETDKPYLRNPEIAACYRRLSGKVLPEAKLLEIPERKVAYVRHQGYDRSIKSAWQLLLAWAKSEGRDDSRQFGLHHSNPAWVDLDKCRYVACIEIDRPLISRGKVNQFIIPGGLHAVFRLQGRYGELLPQLTLILEQWLPSSGMKMNATPAYVQYHKNHFVDDDEKFEIEFFLPVSFY